MSNIQYFAFALIAAGLVLIIVSLISLKNVIVQTVGISMVTIGIILVILAPKMETTKTITAYKMVPAVTTETMIRYNKKMMNPFPCKIDVKDTHFGKRI